MATIPESGIETDRHNLTLERLAITRTALRGLIALGGHPDQVETALLAAFHAAVLAWTEEAGR